MRLVIVLFLITGFAASAQRAPERTPGRVGGSTNNQQVHRPPPTHAKLAPPPALQEAPQDDPQEFQDVRNAMPDVTPQVYHQLRFIADRAKALGKQFSTKEIAQFVAKRHGDAIGALRHDVHLSGHDAHRIFNEALQQQ
jgi:hypothetical protein